MQAQDTELSKNKYKVDQVLDKKLFLPLNKIYIKYNWKLLFSFHCKKIIR